MMMSSGMQMLFIFMKSQILVVNLSACIIDILFRKLSPMQRTLRLFLTFSSIGFNVSALTLNVFFLLFGVQFCAGL